MKPIGVMREGCIFCYSMGVILGREFLVAQAEEQGYDVVARWDGADVVPFVPIQMRMIMKVVPAHLNAEASVQGVVDGLRKYADSRELTVAAKRCRRRSHIRPRDVAMDRIVLGGNLSHSTISESHLT
jgi:hypothetical protein